MDGSIARYLETKRTIDDRALNRGVWERLAAALAAIEGRPVELVEIGAGVGTMIERLIEWGLVEDGRLLAIDAEPGLIEQARQRVARLAAVHPSVESDEGLVVARGGRRLAVALEAIDFYAFAEREVGRRQWDALVAHAVLDLLDLRRAAPAAVRLVRPGGLLYLTLTFDGATIFEPTIEPTLDRQIEALYHETMDRRVIDGRPSGDSRSGRRLFGHLRAAGAEILVAGASDWVVVAGPDGYLTGEADFLRFIIETVRGALASEARLDQRRLAAWVAERQAQIERGELIYIAHQIDILARRPAASAIGR